MKTDEQNTYNIDNIKDLDVIKNSKTAKIGLFVIVLIGFLFYNYKTEIICEKETDMCKVYKYNIVMGKKEVGRSNFRVSGAKGLTCKRYSSSSKGAKYALKINYYHKLDICRFETSSSCESARNRILKNIKNLPYQGEQIVYSRIL